MSGGGLYYKQNHIDDVIQNLKSIVMNFGSGSEPERPLSKKTLREFTNAIRALEKAFVYTERLDYLLAYDDDEATFHERLKQDLLRIRKSSRKGHHGIQKR